MLKVVHQEPGSGRVGLTGEINPNSEQISACKVFFFIKDILHVIKGSTILLCAIAQMNLENIMLYI